MSDEIDAKELETKLRRGDPVTDAELVFGEKLFRRIRRDLDTLGPRWDFAANEARRLEQKCSDYRRARLKKNQIY